MKQSEILGMNARNVQYIARYNTRADKRFADDKLYTKQFLSSRGLGVARLYHVIKDHKQLTDMFFDSLPEYFVIKPNKGSRGRGILVLKKKSANTWQTFGGTIYTKHSLQNHMLEILEGKYSMSGVSDKALVEECLFQHKEIEKITTDGLCDIRVIAFNMVPVMAMVRVPTAESDGKANMDLGGIGVGIDLGTGRTIRATKYDKPVKNLPNGTVAKGIQIPFWDEILHAVSKIQQVSGVGFLGIDMVITTTGVKIIEMNARPGLKIQIANKAGLKGRLRKIEDLTIRTPEEGVNIAKKLFQERSREKGSSLGRPVIGIRESVLLNAVEPLHLIAKIDLEAEENLLAPKYYIDNILDVTVAGKRFKLPVKKAENNDIDIVLAGKYMHDFYIDPKKKHELKIKKLTDEVSKKMILNIDTKLCEIDENVKLLHHINPINTMQQYEHFISHNDFCPLFLYRDRTIDIENLRRDIKKIPQIDHPLWPLYEAKQNEIEKKLDLIEAVGTLHFSARSADLFGTVSQHLYRNAMQEIKQFETLSSPKDKSPILDYKAIRKRIDEFLKEYKIEHISIVEKENAGARIQATKSGGIIIRPDMEVSANRLEELLQHEIGTHVFRALNGHKQPYKIFSRGTANALMTEEGLALYNESCVGLNRGLRTIRSAYTIVAMSMAQKMGFVELYDFLKNTYPELKSRSHWRMCVRVKRGMKDVSQPGAFTKDILYYKGYKLVRKFVEKNGNIQDLYKGKIAIEDLQYLEHFNNLIPAKYLPKHLITPKT